MVTADPIHYQYHTRGPVVVGVLACCCCATPALWVGWHLAVAHPDPDEPAFPTFLFVLAVVYSAVMLPGLTAAVLWERWAKLRVTLAADAVHLPGKWSRRPIRVAYETVYHASVEPVRAGHLTFHMLVVHHAGGPTRLFAGHFSPRGAAQHLAVDLLARRDAAKAVVAPIDREVPVPTSPGTNPYAEPLPQQSLAAPVVADDMA